MREVERAAYYGEGEPDQLEDEAHGCGREMLVCIREVRESFEEIREGICKIFGRIILESNGGVCSRTEGFS